MPVIRTHIEKDLFIPGFPQEKILAAVVSLLERKTYGWAMNFMKNSTAHSALPH